MATKKTHRDYLIEEDKIDQQIRIQMQRLKSTKNLEHRYRMKERTLRLCNIGRTVIRYMPLEEFPDDAITEVLEALFESPKIQEWLKQVKVRSAGCEKTR